MRTSFLATVMAIVLPLFLTGASAQKMADGYFIMSTDSAFADAVADLESAIIDRGLVIDYKGMVGSMLMRTADAVDAISPYKDAVYIQFCSAKHTHAAVAASPENLAICPYVVFAYEVKGENEKVALGYRRPKGATSPKSVEALKGVDALLKEIVEQAAE